MDTRWPTRLGVGDRVRLAGWVHTVVGLHGGVIELSDPYGAVRHADLTELLSDSEFAVVEAAPVPSAGATLCVSGTAAQRAQWWRHHIVEVVTGLPPDAGPGTVPRPPYDPAVFTLAEREAAKARELQRAGEVGMSARTIRRKRHRWQAEGLQGLVDGRSSRRSRTDDAGRAARPEVLKALGQVVADAPAGQPRSVAFYRRATARVLEEKGMAAGDLMPSRTGFYRLYARATAAGVLTPPERFPTVAGWMRPGERVHITMVALNADGWLPGVPLAVTLVVDETSRSILDAVVHPARSRIDSAALVARMCTPAVFRPRPGPDSVWGEAFRTPGDTAVAGQAEPARPGGPVVRPETLMLDASLLAGMDTCRRACQELGINVRRASTRSPAAKTFLDHIARNVSSEFADRLRPAAGYTIHQMQEMLETWVSEVWQNTPCVHRDGRSGGHRALTPNQAHAAAVAAAEWTAMPLSPGEFLRFLPHASRAVGPSGVRVNGRRYDSTGLDSLRNTVTGTRSQPRFTVYWDPCDVRYVFVNGPSEQWITVQLAPARGARTPAPDAGPSPVPARITRAGGTMSHPLRQVPPVADGTTPAFAASLAAPDASPPAEQWRRLVTAAPSFLRPASRATAAPSSDADRVRYHAGLLLPAAPVLSAVREAERLAVLNRGTGAAKRSLMLLGGPGTGKTTALVEIGRIFEDGPDDPGRVRGGPPSVTPSVYITMPPQATAPVLLRELLGFFGLPRPRRLAQHDLARRALAALAAAGTEVVLIDDCHRLRATPASRAQAAELLSYLSGQARSTFVFAWTGGRESLAAALPPGPAQPCLLEAELTDLACDDEWHALVAAAEERLLLRDHTPGTLPALSSYLHRLTGGSLDRLTYLVRSGAIHSIRTGQEAIAEADLAMLSASWLHRPGAGPDV